MHYNVTLKNRRIELNLTQNDLAELTGVGYRTIKLIESGKGNPSLKTLEKIIDVLGLEIELKLKKLIK